MSDRMSRQEWERIKVEDFERLEADLATERARADALATENAELREAVGDYVTACDEGIEVCMGRAPGDGGNAALERSAAAFRALRALLAADPAQPGAELLAAADAMAYSLEVMLREPELIAAYRRLRGGRGPEGGVLEDDS